MNRGELGGQLRARAIDALGLQHPTNGLDDLGRRESAAGDRLGQPFVHEGHDVGTGDQRDVGPRRDRELCCIVLRCRVDDRAHAERVGDDQSGESLTSAELTGDGRP